MWGGHHLPPPQGSEGTFAVRDRAEGQGRGTARARRSLDGSHGGSRQCWGELGVALAPAAGWGPRHTLNLSLSLPLGARGAPAVPQVNPPSPAPAPPAARWEQNLPSQRFPCPAPSPSLSTPHAAPAQALLLAAEQVHKNDLIYYRRHVLKQLTKLQDVKRQASAFSFLSPYRLLAMIKIVFSFLKLELIFLSKAIM